MKNASWNQLFAGDVVSFQYRGLKSSRGQRRVVICLDPKYRYRKKSTGRVVEFFIGLEIDKQGEMGLPKPELKKLLELLGESEQDLAKTTYTDTARVRKIYQKLRTYLVSNPIFKTYLLRECRTKRVFLEDKFSRLNRLQIKEVSKELMKESRTQATLEVGE